MPTTTRERANSETSTDEKPKPQKSKAKRRAKPDESVVEASSDESADEAPKRKAKSKSAKAGKRAARASDAPGEAGESGAAQTASAARASGASRTSAAPASKAASRSAASKGASRSPTSAGSSRSPASTGSSRSSGKSPGKERAPIDLASAVLQALATNERMNQFLLENLDDRAWTLPPRSGQGRTIAAIVSHMHNVRHMWLQVTSKGTSIPEKLDRKSVTKPEAMKALAQSGQALLALFERSLENGGRVKDFKPDVVGFLGYVTAHEAHHRGQVCLLAREHGLPLSNETNFGLWDWNKRWKECGY